ncbi:alpha/beta hydrolase [Alkalilimnicola ehrlichii]|uniref:Alpha/beta hydrolase n=1 Tax=Alkalilimnicola ehrlichii TaxID=351052 RepID=A0A3E0X1R8_9GAMM|nr:alpha/beta fold hydrolase [Alkalilimnicola ehrlichii]RFA31103.1 alpha/beta hydrolase [Alkalilimnicola ehrlichii]RFA39609.1 alpha/beta hydrolase [Alkalilimnicola ehrlichii]
MLKRVYFAHGKESGPWGRKIQALARVAQAHGFMIESPDYSHTFDPQARVQQLLDLKPQADCLVLVGSSMGGYVSAQAAGQLRPNGLFLIAPAFYMPGYESEPQAHDGLIEAVHGWDDDVIPVEHSIRFARNHQARLHLIPGEHTLVEQLPLLERLFGLFLAEVEVATQQRLSASNSS